MADARADFEAASSAHYQAYGLNGQFAESFDLDELKRLFEVKFGYPAGVAKLTAGGCTALVGPIYSSS